MQKSYYASLHLDSHKVAWVAEEKRKYRRRAIGQRQQFVEDCHVNEMNVEVEVQTCIEEWT